MNEPEPAASAASGQQPESPPQLQPSSQQPKKVASPSVMRKLALIAVIFGLLQIPLLMIQGVMEDRQKYNVDFPQEFKGPGAGQQTMTGPVLTVPYHHQVTEQKQVPAAESKGKETTAIRTIKITRTETGHLNFFPENLTVNGVLNPEIRDEGKYKSILYSTAMEFKGAFNTADFKQKKIDEKDLLWDDAFVTLGISDLRGVRKETELNWSGQKYKFIPGCNGLKILDSGQHALITGMQKSGTYPFAFTVNLSGSRDLSVFPAGKENKITLASSWKDPTFSTGGFLPTEKTADKSGFRSVWEVSYFTRNLQQLWTDADPSIKNSLAQYMVGVTLATPVEFYRTAIRAVKYGSLFIIMTFLTFFMFETVTRMRIHEVQYLLVGLALSLFFLLLIAVSEWLPFVWAYVIASIPTIAQITWYTQAFSKGASNQLWKIMAATLTVLYVYLYILLELENLSLLFGAIGLFVALSVVLYITRNVDWYTEEAQQLGTVTTSTVVPKN